MTGDDKSRFCSHCQKYVHDLSAMHRDEAERLLCESAGSLCVRYKTAPNGQIITLDYQQRPKPKWQLAPIAAITTIAAALGGVVWLIAPRQTMGARCGFPVSGATTQSLESPSSQSSTSNP
jgi:hypothetical protein